MVQKQFDITAIGNAIVDIMHRCDETFLEKLHVQKGHMTLVQRSSEISQIRRSLKPGFDVSGGASANTAVGVASLGGQAAFIGTVADDEFGHAFRHDIVGTGVTFATAPRIGSDHETSHSLILTTPDGQRTMLTFLGCSAHIESTAIDPALISASKIVFLEGYLFDSPTAKAAFRRAISLANSSGKRVALALSDSLCVERHRAEFFDIIRSGVAIVFANESEIKALYQVTQFEDAVQRAGRDIALAVLTRSAKGSVVVSKGTATAIPAEAVRKAVDLTGAGDMFAAGFLFGLASGMDFKRAATLGSFAAAEIISISGARPEVRLGHLARMRGLLT